MKKILYSIIAFAIILLSACDDVNTMHDKYLQNGEDFLVGKVDSFKLYGGKNRAKFVVWVGDYRAQKMLITRPDTSLTYTFTYNNTNRVDSMVFYIDNLREGTNLLYWNNYSADDVVKSIPQNSSVTVWGERYESFLVNRSVTSYRFNVLTKAFTVTWNAKNSVEPTFGRFAIGHEIKYKTVSGNDTILKDVFPVVDKIIQAPSISVLQKFPLTGGEFSYRMMYSPDPLCVDTFYTSYNSIQVP